MFDMPLHTENVLSQNPLAYTISMKALNGNIDYVAIVLSLMIIINLSMSGHVHLLRSHSELRKDLCCILTITKYSVYHEAFCFVGVKNRL